ncbi:centromere protein P isoform X3 [Pongo pygmaeus]|uniref:centromere protein P isoform X3 n=1 Tax=Pongo pygmaeus TaxID=9600 RepID=UPI00300CB4ED
MDAELAEVRALQAEIAALRRAWEDPPAPWEEKSRVQKSFQAIHQFNLEGWKSSKDLKNQLGHLESELSFLSTLTGINIRNHSKQTEDLTSTEMTEKSIRKVLQRHRLSGNCHMVTFQLEFQILEIQNKERLSSAVTDLNIIMEPTECSELSEFVSRAEERKDLFMFFRSLHFFVEWFEYRKRTFKHFKGLTLSHRMDCSGTNTAHCSLDLPGSSDPTTSVPQVTETTEYTPSIYLKKKKALTATA